MADKVKEATPGPYHLHDMERFTICGPDHLAIALCEAKNRSDEENQANTDLLAASLARYASKKARG